jgi:hypothetical protein
MVESHAVVKLVELAFAAKASEKAADGFAGEACHAAKLFVRELHEEGEGEIGVEGAVAGLVRAGEVEEGAGEFASRGGMESEAASGKDGSVVFAGEGLGNELTDTGGVGHEANKVGARDGSDDTGFEGFGRYAIAGSLKQRRKPKEVAGAGNAEEEKTAFGGGGDYFYPPAAHD